MLIYHDLWVSEWVSDGSSCYAYLVDDERGHYTFHRERHVTKPLTWCVMEANQWQPPKMLAAGVPSPQVLYFIIFTSLSESLVKHEVVYYFIPQTAVTEHKNILIVLVYMNSYSLSICTHKSCIRYSFLRAIDTMVITN